MDFEIIGPIEKIETIARRGGIQELRRLNRVYGKARWRKRKGVATIRLVDGSVRRAEIHWCEAHGIGRKELKIKQVLT